MFREQNKVCEICDLENMVYPWGLAAREDSLFVTDGVTHSVLKYSLDGTFLRKAGLLGGGKEELDNPMGISCGDMVYVCDSGNNRIQVCVVVEFQSATEVTKQRRYGARSWNGRKVSDRGSWRTRGTCR